jgi:hypothetical protein
MTRTRARGADSTTETSAGIACYVYAVVPAGVTLPALSGVDDVPVRMVTVGDVAAGVGDVALDRPPGRRAEILAHSRVVDALAAETVVVPVRFGSMLEDDRSVVEDLLLPEQEQFADYLEQLRGRAQFTVRATYHEDTALAEVVSTRPEIAELRRLTRELPEDQGYSERVRLGELVSHAMDDKRAFDAQVLLDAMLPLVAAHSVRAGGGLEHVVDVAVLVDDERREAFEEHLEWLAESVHERIRMRLMGPMAPYDFVGGGSWG